MYSLYTCHWQPLLHHDLKSGHDVMTHDYFEEEEFLEFSIWPCRKYFWHPSLVILLFCNPTHKTETGTANMWELLIANHLDESLWWDNKEQGSRVRSYLLHSSLACAQLCCAFHQHQQGRKTTFLSRNRHVWTFLHPLFNVQGHILSTGGVL
jgi:hypothetical protein